MQFAPRAVKRLEPAMSRVSVGAMLAALPLRPRHAMTDRDNVLRAFCDTIFPAIEAQDDPTDFWRRSSVDLCLDQATAAALAALPESERFALERLLDALSARGLAELPPNARERVLAELSQASIDAAIG